MRRVSTLALAVAGAALLTGGCANLPRARDSGAVNDLITSRGAPPATWPDTKGNATPDGDATLAAVKTGEPITVN